MPRLPTGTVTFVFTDIEGSTRLLRSLGDRYAEVLSECRRLLRTAFQKHHGQEVDIQGDAMFYAFPRAKDAVAAAMTAQLAITGHSWPEDSPVRVRMGLHTGEPLSGAAGYVGMDVHRAARICAAGHGGQILLSQTTRDLVADDLPDGVSLRDLGEHLLKDLVRPEHLFQVIRADLSAEFAPLKSQRHTPDWERHAVAFVGRERELGELLAALTEAEGGRGRLFLLGGEPGIGKSRLADELAARASERGALVLWGRCWEAGGAPAYWPWVQSLRVYVRGERPETLRIQLGGGAVHLAQILPDLDEIFSDLPSPPTLDPETARFYLFDAAATLLRNIAKSRPVVLLLEDLHAADAPSLLLLRFVAPEIASARVLLVGTYRDTELSDSHPLTAALADLARHQVTRPLRVGGLAEPEVARFIENTAGHRPTRKLLTAVHDETEGNPLFVGEVVRLLSAEGRFDSSAEAPVLRLQIPQGIRQVIGRRLALLSESCRRVLTDASVLGREFSADVLEHVGDLSGDTLLDALDEAFAARVIGEVPGSLGQLRFSHALLRDALYDDLAPARRQRLHRRMGEVLEGLYAENLEPHLAELAHHFVEAAPLGDVDRAIRYARAAGDRALRLLAYEEASRLYQMTLQALQLKAAPDNGVRCELLLALGDAQGRAGDMPEAKQTFLQAADIARRAGLAERLARAALGYGGRFVWEAARGDKNLVPLLEDALKELPEEDSELRVKIMARLGGGPLRDVPQRELRSALTKQAVEMARRLGDPATLAYALDGHYAAIWWPENLEERIAIATELIGVGKEARDKERELQGYHYRILAHLEHGSMPAVYTDLQAKVHLAEDLRQPAQQWYLDVVRVTLTCFEGRLYEVEDLLPQVLALGERIERPMGWIYFAIQTHALRWLQGRIAEAEEILKEAIRIVPTYPVLRCALAHVYAELGRERQAREVFEPLAANRFAGVPQNDEWLYSMCLLAEVAAHLRDATRSATLHEMLLPYASRNAVSAPDACSGSVSRSLGVLGTALSLWADAEHHFENAVEMNLRTGGKPWAALSRDGYARMLLARAHYGDRVRAQNLLQLALDTYKNCGMTALMERTAKVLASVRS